MYQRQRIRDLAANDEADTIFLLGNASLQQSRNGLYWRLELRDADGVLEGKIWSPLSSSYHDLAAGQMVHVRGRISTYRDQLQLNVESLKVLTDKEAAQLDLADFMPSSPRPVAEMQDELDALIEKELRYAPWKKFVRAVLDDERVKYRLAKAPAAKSVHHAYVGGLLEHMLSVASLCMNIADHYPELDRQLLCAAALLHDIGKLEEMSGGIGNEYTDAGRFLGHITQGLLMMEEHLVASGLDRHLALHFRHLIASHHGEREYGSPVLPSTSEAFVLHYADNIDAKLAQLRSLLPDGPQEEGSSGEMVWTPWQNLLGRSLCHVPATPSVPEEAPLSSELPASTPSLEGEAAASGGEDDCGSEDVSRLDELNLLPDAEKLVSPAPEAVVSSDLPAGDAPIESYLSPWTEVELLAEAAAESAATVQPEAEGEEPEGTKALRRKSPSRRRKTAEAEEEAEGEVKAESRAEKTKDLTQCSLL